MAHGAVAYGARARETAESEILEWEARWSLPAGLATFVGVALVIASAFVIGSVSGDGEAELLRSAHEHSSAVTLSSILRRSASLFLVPPLVVLFRAVAARSDRVRYQLIGLVVAAPLFLAAAAVLNATATNEAADQFVAGNAKPGITAKEADAGLPVRTARISGAKEFGEEFGGGSRDGGAQTDCSRDRSPTRRRATRSAKPRPAAPPPASASAAASASRSPSSTPASTRCGPAC